tara:strand:+ start:241 stop:774 length:534 start_codon:yes stop_codon:yes gene_type:complete
MTKEEKAAIIEGLVEKFQSNGHFYITDAGGLSVAKINNFRKMCFDKGVEYKVYKNTLIAKALEQMDTDYTDFSDKVLKGFSGVIFSQENGKLPAQILIDYRKKSGKDKPLLKGASIDRDVFVGDDQLKTLSKLKSKQELIGEIIGLLQSPATNVISALQSGKHTLAGLVKTLSERES